MAIIGKNLEIARELDEEGYFVTGDHTIIGGSKFKPPRAWNYTPVYSKTTRYPKTGPCSGWIRKYNSLVLPIYGPKRFF
jgi:hypothetical protein